MTLSSSHQTIFLSSLSHHAAHVFLTVCLAACACFSLVLRLLCSCFALAYLMLSCACFKRYFSIIRRNHIFVVFSLHDWFHDSRSSPSAPTMIVFYQNKTSAITLIKQFHGCNYKVWWFLSCIRVWTPWARNSNSVCRGPDPFSYYSYMDWGSRPPTQAQERCPCPCTTTFFAGMHIMQIGVSTHY